MPATACGFESRFGHALNHDLTRRMVWPIVRVLARRTRQLRLAAEPAAPTGPAGFVRSGVAAVLRNPGRGEVPGRLRPADPFGGGCRAGLAEGPGRQGLGPDRRHEADRSDDAAGAEGGCRGRLHRQPPDPWGRAARAGMAGCEASPEGRDGDRGGESGRCAGEWDDDHDPSDTERAAGAGGGQGGCVADAGERATALKTTEGGTGDAGQRATYGRLTDEAVGAVCAWRVVFASRSRSHRACEGAGHEQGVPRAPTRLRHKPRGERISGTPCERMSAQRLSAAQEIVSRTDRLRVALMARYGPAREHRVPSVVQ